MPSHSENKDIADENRACCTSFLDENGFSYQAWFTQSFDNAFTTVKLYTMTITKSVQQCNAVVQHTFSEETGEQGNMAGLLCLAG